MDICSIKNVTIPIKSSSVLMRASGKTPALLFIQDLLQQVYLKGSFSNYVRKISKKKKKKKKPQKNPTKNQHFFSCDTHWYQGVRNVLSPDNVSYGWSHEGIGNDVKIFSDNVQP